MSTEFKSPLAQVRHAVFYGISDALSDRSSTYDKLNKSFQKNKALVVKRSIKLGLTLGLVACASPVEAPSAEKTIEPPETFTAEMSNGTNQDFIEKANRYVSNFDGYKVDGSFTITVDDSNPDTVPVTEEVAVVSTNSPAQGLASVGLVGFDDSGPRPMDYDTSNPKKFNIVDRKTRLTVLSADTADVLDGGKITLYYNPLPLGDVTDPGLQGYDGTPIPITVDEKDGFGRSLLIYAKNVAPSSIQPSATLEPTATQAPTETPAPTATPEVVRVEDYFGLGPAEITQTFVSENQTEYYFKNPDLLTATDFGEAIAQNSEAWGGPLEILSFRAVLTGYTVDKIKLLAPTNPDVPTEGEVATLEFVYKLKDGSVHSIKIPGPGGISLPDRYETFKGAKEDLKIGRAFSLDLMFIPIGSQASHEKILGSALKNIPNLEGPQDERKFTMFLSYLDRTSRSIILKQLKGSSYPPQSIEQGTVILKLK